MAKNFESIVTEEFLIRFYGLETVPYGNANKTREIKRLKEDIDREDPILRQKLYEKADEVDLTQFMAGTRPTYWVDNCFYGSYDCAANWQRLITFHGQCLFIDANKFPNYSPGNGLDISIVINGSDNIGGWQGTDKGGTTLKLQRGKQN